MNQIRKNLNPRDEDNLTVKAIYTPKFIKEAVAELKKEQALKEKLEEMKK